MSAVEWIVATSMLLCAGLPSEGLPQAGTRLVEHITDGFSGLSLLQDREGFIWCGTGNGLFCYDGYTVEFLRHSESDSATLSHDQVNALALGDDGRIWVGTPVGLDVLNPVTRTVRRLSLRASGLRASRQVYVTSILVDSGGVLWVGTQEQGLLEVTVPRGAEQDALPTHQHSHRPDNPASLSHNHVHALWSDTRNREGSILVGTSCGLNRLWKATGVCERYMHDPHDALTIPHDEVWGIVGGDSGDVWLGTGDGLCRLRTGGDRTGQFERPPIAVEGPVSTLSRDREGNLWFGTYASTIVRYRYQTGEIQQQSIEKEFYGRRYINAIYSSICDRQGAVWFGVHYGLERYDPARKHFEFFPIAPIPGRWLVETTAFCEDNGGDLWIATDSRGVFRHTTLTRRTFNYLHRDAKPHTLSSDEVNTLLKDRLGNVWIGTTRGLDRYRPATDSFEHIAFEPSSPGTSHSPAGRCVYDLLEAVDGNLWIATNAGLSRLNPLTRQVTDYLHRGEMAELGSYIGAIVQPGGWKDGDLLLGSKGLYRFSPATGALTRYPEAEGFAGTHIDQMIIGLLSDRVGNVWVSTFAGLYLLGAGGVFRHFSAPDDLPTNLVCQIAEDQLGDIWVSTATSGVARFDPGNGRFRSYQVKEGFLKNSFCIRGSFTASDGTLYIGAANGFLRFHPSRIGDNPFVPIVRITAMHVLDRPVMSEIPFEKYPGVVLAHTDNIITIDFVGLCYTDPEKTQYAYLLEGLSEEWLHCGTQRRATFTNLDPGSYLFRVKACNCDGIWSDAETSLRIVIEPPFWKTWWFRAIACLVFAALVYGAYRYRLAKMLALERLRLRIANDLHDDIGSDLSSLALESDLIARRLAEGEPGRERLQAVGRTIRNAADNLRDVVWIVSPDQDRVQDLVERMREVTAKMLSGLSHEFRSAGSTHSPPLDIEFKRHVLMMFKEMLHNVVSHARASRVEVEFELNNGHMRLCVRDDGVGFDPSGEQSGRGLRSLQTRASTIGGTLTIESAPGRGTTVCLEANIARL